MWFNDYPFIPEWSLAILISPLVAAVGFVDSLFIGIPVAISYLLKYKFGFSVFKSYWLSATICYCMIHFYVTYIANSSISFMNYKTDEKLVINNFVIVVPVLALSILINYIVFNLLFVRHRKN
jgi:hypothetical protein